MNSRVDGVPLHERRDGAVAAGPPPQRRHEMRVRQAAHVEHQVGVDRHAVLVAEAEERHRPAARATRSRDSAHEELPQLVDRHVRRVDDLVGHARGWRSAARARRGCPSLDRPVRRERMRPPRLAEPPHERRVARLEEDQHRVEPRHLPQPRGRSSGTTTGSSPSRTSTTIATFSMSPPARSDSFASVGMSVVGRLSTQK